MWHAIFNKYKPIILTQTDECSHTDTYTDENSDNICSECGTILSRKFNSNEYSLTSSIRHKTRKCVIIEEMPPEYDAEIRNMAVTMYNVISVTRSYRSKFRKAVIAACLHRASIVLNRYISPVELVETLGITVAMFEKGVFCLSTNLHRDDFRVPYYIPLNDMGSTARLLGLSDVHYIKIHKLYNRVDYLYNDVVFVDTHRSVIIASCIWLYIIHHKLNVNKSTFMKATGMVEQVVFRKYVELRTCVMRSIMKRFISWCFVCMFPDNIDKVSSADETITVNNYRDPSTISIIGKHEYQLDNVHNINDWNKFTIHTAWCKPDTYMGVKVSATRTGVSVLFTKCASDTICNHGESIINSEIDRLLFNC